MSTQIPHLPHELHLLVGQYVRRDDLASYRLASKLLLSIGTAELFGTLTFHYGTASLARLASIGNCEHLRKHVETVFWDINLWRIPKVRDLHEWQAYFCNKAALLRRWNCEEQACRLDHLAQNRKEWVAYLDKVDDERVARRDPSRLVSALKRFYNLRTTHVVHGELVPTHRGIRKVSDEVNSASVEPVVLRRGEGMNDLGSQTGNEALLSLFESTFPRLTKLKLDRIHFTNPFPKPLGNFDSLRSLDIKISARADGFYGPASGPYVECHRAALLFRQGALRLFLMHLPPQLESLKIDLDCCTEEHTRSSFLPLAHMRDIFGTCFTWPRLRQLSLCHFFATPETLISLVARHRETLKDLRLRNIILDKDPEEMEPSPDRYDSSVVSAEEYGWPKIFQHLAGCMELEHATLSGHLATTKHQQESWDLDANLELAAATSEYLVHRRECPW